MNRTNGNGQYVELPQQQRRDLGRENKAPLSVHFKPEGIILSRGDDCFFVPNEELLQLDRMLTLRSQSKCRDFEGV